MSTDRWATYAPELRALLIELARAGTAPITYGVAARHLGIAAQSVGRVLSVIERERPAGEPELFWFVVSARTGRTTGEDPALAPAKRQAAHDYWAGRP